jgi:hypothetical protein
MVNNDVVAYIKKSQGEKKSEDQIRQDLTQAGWDPQAITEAYNAVSGNGVPTPPSNVPIPPKPKSYTSAWDAFEHILMFLSLYSMAISIGLILHQAVDKWFPGINEYGRISFASDEILHGAIAGLIVTMPLFIFFHLNVTRRTLRNPQLRNLKVRRVFIYITLFYTFIHMVTKLVTTIFTFLQGNVGVNFVLHTIITIAITGTIFGYYLYQVKEDRRDHA